MKDEINKVNQEKEELLKQLAEAKMILAQAPGHQVTNHETYRQESLVEEEKEEEVKGRLIELLQKSRSKK